MLSDDPQNQPSVPTHLPPIAADQPLTPTSAGAASSAVGADTATQYAEKAKQLIAQHGNDPYRLGEAINQLKASYLAQQHHIAPNQAGS